MKPVLMFTEQDRLDRGIENHKIYFTPLNDVLNAYQKLQLGQIDYNDFKQLVADPECFIFDKMTGGEKMEINGFKVSKHKALDLLEKPEGYQNLIAAIEVLKVANGFTLQELNIHDLVENQIVLSQAFIDKQTEAAKVYATNEKELKLFEFLNRVMKDAVKTFGEGGIDINKLMSECVKNFAHPIGNGEHRQFFIVNYRPIKSDNFYI